MLIVIFEEFAKLGAEYRSTIHFFTGLVITVLSLILVNIACREGIAWTKR